MTGKQARSLAKAGKGAWSPAARAKRKATFAAKAADKLLQKEGEDYVVKKMAKDALPQHVKDAIVFLEHGEKALIKSIAAGNKRISVAETHMLLALKTLRGET